MQAHRHMLKYLAGRVHTDFVLYLCLHNPMIDCPMIEMQELIKKANRTIALVVILPVLEHLDATLSLSSGTSLRLRTKCVATYCDWTLWLMSMASGTFAHIALVLPCEDITRCDQYQAWKCAERAADAFIIE